MVIDLTERAELVCGKYAFKKEEVYDLNGNLFATIFKVEDHKDDGYIITGPNISSEYNYGTWIKNFWKEPEGLGERAFKLAIKWEIPLILAIELRAEEERIEKLFSLTSNVPDKFQTYWTNRTKSIYNCN